MNKVQIETPEFASFFAGCQKIHSDYMARSFPEQKPDVFTCKAGSRYIRIDRERSVHAFVDRTNGDVLKPATYKAPAKHARGNIFDSTNGLGTMGEFGPAYLR